MKIFLTAAVAATVLLAGAASAQAPASCAGAGNLACIVQIGHNNDSFIDQRDATTSTAVVLLGEAGSASNNARLNLTQRGVGNQALVGLEGRRNGRGTIHSEREELTGYSSNLIALLTGISLDDDDVDADPVTGARPALVTERLASGVVAQDGDGNRAAVMIAGDDNKFHLSQNGDRNVAIQAVLGSDNAVALVQGGAVLPGGGGDSGNRNRALQLQVGNGNVAYARQTNHRNTAVQVQVGTGSLTLEDLAGASSLDGAELMEFADSLSGSSNNRVLLEQHGDADAVMLQAGHDNLIALKQPAGARAVIGQFGSGHDVQIEQRAGRFGITPIVITQTGG